MCDSMGLFDNKTEEQLIIEAYNKVAGVSMVNCKVVVGTYGNEDIIAGAMIGETGKYLAMANYGNPKWENSVLEFHVNGVVFTNPGWSIMYHDIIDLKIARDGFRHSELLFSLSDGGKVLWLYVVGQTFNIALTFLAVWFLLSGVVFDVPVLDLFK